MLKAKINKLDRLFSQYIRRRDTSDGFGRCITCGTIIHYDTCDAGHYISRAYFGTRWNELNVHAQCRSCNRYLDGNGKIYRQILIKRYGLSAVETMERRRHDVVHLNESGIDELIKHYQQKIKTL